jgi:hypothetical protein
MNIYAYHPSDPTRSLLHIDDWVVKYGVGTDGCCRICHKPMGVKGDKSQRQTHFAHQQHSGCPTVAENHIPYAGLRALPRDPSIESAAKTYALENIEGIYFKMKKFVTALSWKEMLELLETARRENIWSLKDMPHEYIPYVLLTCTTSFKANKQYGRNQEMFFVLEPSPDAGDYWNFPKGYKRYIWEITLPGRVVTHHELELTTPTVWYMGRVNELLA